MKKIMLVILVSVLVISVFGCGTTQFVCPDGKTTVSDKAKCPAVQEEQETPKAPVTQPAKVEVEQGTTPVTQPKTTTTPTPPTPTQKTMDADLVKILSNINKVTSYEFVYQYGTQDVSKYTVVGDKVKVSLMFGNHDYYNYGYYDRILLDTRAKTAVAYCVERSACTEESKKIAKNVNYEDFAMPFDPISLVKSVTYAEISEEITCDDDRPCTIIKFDEGGEEVEMHIDNYYGFPYYWKKGNVERKLSAVVYMPRDPEVALPSTVEQII